MNKNSGFTFFLWLTFLLVSVTGCTLIKKESKLSKRKSHENSYLFIGALQMKLTGRNDEALEVFGKVASSDPNHAASRYEMARIYAERKDYQTALDYIRQAIKIEPKSKWYRLLLIDIYDRTGEFKLKIPVYNQLIKEYPKDMSLYYGLSNTYYQMKNLKGAIDVLIEVESKTGISEDISIQKYQYYLMIGNNKAAIEEIKKLASVFPGEPAYTMAIGDFYLQTGNYYEALSHYSSIYNQDNNNYEALISLAECYMRIGNKTKATELIATLFRDPAVDIDPKMNIMMYYYEVSEKDTTFTSQSYQLLDIFVQTHPGDAKVNSVYGDFLFRDKKFKEAADKWQNVIAVDPSKYVVWEHLLMCYDELKEYQTLEKTALQAAEYFPEQPGPYFYAGYAMFLQKKYDLSLAYLFGANEKAVSDKKQKILALGYLAEAFHYLNRHASSDSVFEKIIELDPKNYYALNNYSYYLSLRGENLEKALSMSEKTIKSNPASPTYLDTYGWILYQLGRYSEAKEYIEKAVELSSRQNPEILLHFGDVLYKLGRYDECLRYWKLAIDAGGDVKELNKRIEKLQ